MKVLFDTNVYVSEALVGGLAESLIDATLKARWRAFTATYVLDELERVLREKLNFSPRVAALARQRARRRCELSVTPDSRHEGIKILSMRDFAELLRVHDLLQ